MKLSLSDQLNKKTDQCMKHRTRSEEAGSEARVLGASSTEPSSFGSNTVFIFKILLIMYKLLV